MKPILEYSSFRTFLLDYYKERHEFGFTWRDFAKIAGYSSPVFLKLVCDAKANLSELGVERVASAIGLVGVDLQYFRALVRYEQEKDSKKRETFWKELRCLAKENSFHLVGEEQYDYYASWRHPVLRELVSVLPSAKPVELANLFVEETSAAEVRKALSVLLQTGFLKEQNGKLSVVEKSVSTGILEPGKLAIRNMHYQMGELALKALENVEPSERDVSGLTMGISKNAYQRIVEETAAFRRRLAAIAMESEGEERVYRMNLQFFPLTKANRRKSNEN